ncbi:MAG: glycosyltransferase family 1 protein [Clostridiales bacterium]|nr:glycosyltransferase family 1 protein [Clostridiales bacterium]
MVRVLQVVGRMDCGGLETLIMRLYRGMDRNKVQFDFLEYGEGRAYYDDEIEQMGGKIHRVVSKKQTPVRSILETAKIMKQYPIIHAHISSANEYFNIFLAELCGVKVRIAHSHSTSGLNNHLNTICRFFLSGTPTDYFACSSAAAKWLFPGKIIKNREYAVFQNAIDILNFTYNPTVRKEVRNKLGLSHEFAVGNVGRFCRVKNHGFLIDIFEKIHRIQPNSVLLLVGDGPLKKDIEEKVNRLGLSENVRFLGLRSDVPDLMQAMDAFVFPSLFEGLPIALVEAQTAGLRCFVSDAVPREVKITDSVQFIPLGNPAGDWAEKICGDGLSYERQDSSAQIRAGGYEISAAARKLQDFYLRHEKMLRGKGNECVV